MLNFLLNIKEKQKNFSKIGSSTTLTDGSQVIRINFSHLIYWLSSGTRLYLKDFQQLFPDLPLLFFIKK